MLTRFGTLVRQHRVTKPMKLKEMASLLGVSDSLLSAVEYGRRSIPDGWGEKIAKILDLAGEQATELRDAITASQWSVTFPVRDSDDDLRRDVTLAFSQFLADADVPTLEEFRDYMLRRRYGHESWKRGPGSDNPGDQ